MSKSTLKIIQEALLASPFQIEFNEMIGTVQINRSPILPKTISVLRLYLSKMLELECSKDHLETVLDDESSYPKFNPVVVMAKKYTQKQCEGKIKEYAARVPTYFGTANTEDFRPDAFKDLFLKFYVGVISGGLPEITLSNEIMLIISGSQMAGKTWFVKHMLPKDLMQYFSKYTIKREVDDREVKVKMRTNLLILDDEGGYMDENSTAAMKDILSSRQLMVRPLYSDRTILQTKTASFIMTSNYKDHLRDDTGNRRFFVIDTDTTEGKTFESIKRNPSTADLKKEDKDRELMVAEAYHLIKSGFDFQLTVEEVNFYNSQMKENHVEGVEHSMVEKYFDLPQHNEEVHVLPYVDFENLAKKAISGTFNRKMLKVAMRAKGFKLGQHLTPLSQKRLSGYKIAAQSLILHEMSWAVGAVITSPILPETMHINRAPEHLRGDKK